MELRLAATVFITVFLAELGDKTQLATLLYGAHRPGARLAVFLGASCALVLSTGLAVLLGEWIGRSLSPGFLRVASGVGFILVGAVILLTGWGRPG